MLLLTTHPWQSPRCSTPSHTGLWAGRPLSPAFPPWWPAAVLWLLPDNHMQLLGCWCGGWMLPKDSKTDLFPFHAQIRRKCLKKYPPGCRRPLSALCILMGQKDPLDLPQRDWIPTQHEDLSKQKAEIFSLSAFYLFIQMLDPSKNWPLAGLGDTAESSSTEQRDSRGTLMLYTWLNTRGCSLAVWFSDEAGGAWPPAGVCLLTLVVRTSLLSADGAAGDVPWRGKSAEKS